MERALFAGTFDPVTNGHLDLVERGIEIFDSILVGVAASERKSTLFSLDERVEMFRRSVTDLDRVEVLPFSGLLVDLAREHNVRVTIRGLRMVADFESEYQMALMNRQLDDRFDTVFLMPSAAYVFLNSTVVREIASFGGNLDGLVPDIVARKLREKFPGRG
jgi:pantetheine-phosphate adenylyltransferase